MKSSIFVDFYLVDIISLSILVCLHLIIDPLLFVCQEKSKRIKNHRKCPLFYFIKSTTERFLYANISF